MARKGRGSKGKAFERPHGEIRRSQLITTYGPGAMVDLVDEAVLIGGLDFWSYDRAKGHSEIQEPRLRDALAPMFELAGRKLTMDHPFREPPAGDDRDPTRFNGIAALEFPRWFVCQNPGCRALVRSDSLERKKDRYWHTCDRSRQQECVPVRFVVACRRGHLDEFPWRWFAHMDAAAPCGAPSLRLQEGATGDFSEILVSCSCGARRRLSTFLNEEMAPRCLGERPWLGREGKEECTEQHVRLLVRTASNSYFAQIVSALSIPELGRELEDGVQECWDVLQAATKDTLPVFLTVPKVSARLKAFTPEDILAAIEARRRGVPVAREPLRTAEFRQLVDAPVEQPGELPDPEDEFFARTWAPADALPDGVQQIVLVSKLREVRAQIGFTRIESVSPNLEGEFDLEVEAAPLGLATNWLPATEVRGEGVFLRLDPEVVLEWEGREAVRQRARELLAGFDAWTQGMARTPRFPGVRFYLLHSLSHLLLNAISLECGYSASAIRERLYCSSDDPPMTGILLSTGSTGTEGTLGGLVGQGRHLREHLRRAWDLGQLCSHDPVCAGHSPQEDPSERYLEGAACHGCLFIAECSCERYNKYLDRALVVPTLGHPPELAFFAERP